MNIKVVKDERGQRVHGQDCIQRWKRHFEKILNCPRTMQASELDTEPDAHIPDPTAEKLKLQNQK